MDKFLTFNSENNYTDMQQLRWTSRIPPWEKNQLAEEYTIIPLLNRHEKLNNKLLRNINTYGKIERQGSDEHTIREQGYSDGGRKKIEIKEGPSGNFMLGKGIFFLTRCRHWVVYTIKYFLSVQYLIQ